MTIHCSSSTPLPAVNIHNFSGIRQSTRMPDSLSTPVSNRLKKRQVKFLNSIVNLADIRGSLIKSTSAWLNNLPDIQASDIQEKDFANFCGINRQLFKLHVIHEQRARLPLSALQQSLVWQVIAEEQCIAQPISSARAWVKNYSALSGAGIYPDQFAHESQTSPITHAILIKRLCSGRRKRMVPPRVIVQIDHGIKLIDNIIEEHCCRGNSHKSALAWLSNRNLFKLRGITLAQFSQHCEVNASTLSPILSRIKFIQFRKAELAVIPTMPVAAIKTEITERDVGITQITLDNSGNELAHYVIAEPNLRDKALIDNNMPICGHPDNPQQSLTLQVLGLGPDASVRDIKVTNWGAMHGVFGGMSVNKRVKLKEAIIKELHRQIMNETEQGERMDKLMKNAGSHYQTRNGDEILNLGIGFFNPGPEPVAANTVLGIYAGLYLDQAAQEEAIRKNGSVNSITYSWATRSEKYIVDAFNIGNILRNINTGNLPGNPQLSDNNTAAVQVNSRVMAYITNREIASGEEYFVDYGIHYNPELSIEIARNEELTMQQAIKTEAEETPR